MLVIVNLGSSNHMGAKQLISEIGYLHTILTLTSECSARGHLDCSNKPLCDEVSTHVAEEIAAFQKAAGYELDKSQNFIGGEGPNSRSSTAALFNCVSTLILSPPWENPLKRKVWSTTALAKLAERGIPADAVVRKHLARPLLSKIAFHIALAWHHSKNTGEPQKIPRVASAWLERFMQTTELPPTAARVKWIDIMVEVSTGEFRKLIENWIATTSITHIIEWELVDVLSVEVPHETLTTKGGQASTNWIFDRFTKDFLAEWRTESVAWELSFAREPEATAHRAGIYSKWLHERPTSATLAEKALIRQHTRWANEPDVILSGTNEAHVMEDILYLIHNDELGSAQEFATEVAHRNPGSMSLRRLAAFTLIPTDPASAQEFFASDDDAPHPWLRQANLFSCSILLGDKKNASSILQSITEVVELSGPAWLWDVADSWNGYPPLIKTHSAEWLKYARTLIQET